MRFRVRLSNWFTSLSALAFQSLQMSVDEDDVSGDPFQFMRAYDFEERSRRSAISRRRRSTMRRCNTGERRVFCASMETLNFLAQSGDIFPFRSDHRITVLCLPTQKEQEQLGPLTPEDRVFRVSSWIVEAIIAEHQQGRLKTHPAILSRIFQELSDGMLGYNQACKIAFIPFPFPFAQIMALVISLWAGICPVVIDHFTQSLVITPFLTVLILVSYVGLNQIAMNLEMPFGLGVHHLPLSQIHEQLVDYA
eukprot:CAMPEP_0204364316 /NCGR_PEP_ID=MMETSP0469-20131031/41045_1 /ASSEMBLY_ACC=CAM_ASM_000384 /TAXON_ID=2969 /ORGANISM="Oxyrrhis marina" /LENGTH=250 /DNA_ID=CAMNT_0051353193 /DNA_START=1 /DNA_END=749 /DNA_ORIENTATION=-